VTGLDRTELEERIRAALRLKAEGAPVSPEAWEQVERRLRRRRRSRLAALAAAAAVLAAAVVAAPRLIDLATRQRVVVPGGPGPGPTGGPPPEGPYFPGFWPATSYEQAREIQVRVDRGEEAWRTDPIEVARRFTMEFLKIQTGPMNDSSQSGSSAAGWRAEVGFNPLVGEGRLREGPAHMIQLYGLPGAERPAWFVSGAASENIVVARPTEGEPVSSPMTVAGRGNAFEGTIHVVVRDDAGTTLHPRPGLPEGFVTAGMGALYPFTGELELLPPGTRAGIVIFTGDTGTGAVPDWTIVRIVFAANLPTAAPRALTPTPAASAPGPRPAPSPAPSG
jgi:hypothetical protein